MMRALLLLLCLLSAQAWAVVYIDCSCSTNGNGTTTTCGATGPFNAAVTTVSASTEYSYARGSTCALASTAITVNQNSVTLSAYGSGAKPIITAGTTTYPLVLGAANSANISGLDIRAGSSGAININGTGTGSTIEDVSINTAVIGFIVNAAGVASLTLSNMDITCTGATSICTQVSANGGGIVFEDSSITLTASDRSSTSLIGLRLAGTATTADSLTISGGNLGVEIRTTDGHTVQNSSVSGQSVSGIRIRDSDNNKIRDNIVYDVWDGVAYNSGTGAGIDLIDVSDACGSNRIERNYLYRNYQAIVDQCDVGGGNWFVSNTIRNHRVNGISYQSDGAEGQILNNSILHDPDEGVGHGIVIQQGSVTTTARILNNTCTNMQAGDNIQCVSLPLSASTGPTLINNNNWYAGVNGAYLAKLDQGTCSAVTSPPWCSYTTLASWQTALGTDADTTGDDAASLSTVPRWVGGPTPSTAAGFKISSNSALIRGGICYSTSGCIAPDFERRRAFVPPDIGAYQRVVGDP